MQIEVKIYIKYAQLCIKRKRVIRKKKDRRRLNRKYKDKSEKYLTLAQKTVKYNKK